MPRTWRLEYIRCFADVLQRQREWDATAMRRDFDQPARLMESIEVSRVTGSKRAVTRLSQQRVKGLYRSPRIRRQRASMPLPDGTETLEAIVVQKTPGSGARLRSFGVVVGVAIAATAVFALTHLLKNVDYNEVFAVVRRTNTGFIALALVLVAISYGSLTLYDLLALRTIGRKDVPYKIAALASFTSYPIAHGA